MEEGFNVPNYYLFMLISIILIVTPGPDFALITKNTLLRDSSGGRATTYGVVTGHILHTSASALGLSILVAKSIILYEIVKYIGAVYLIYLGITALQSKQKSNLENPDYTDNAPLSKKLSKNQSCFLQGVISTIFNPKAIIFYITFLPQFIDPRNNVLMQSIVLSGIFVLLVLVWFLLYVSVLNYISEWFIKPSIQLIFERITGIILISLGIKLAFEKG